MSTLKRRFLEKSQKNQRERERERARLINLLKSVSRKLIFQENMCTDFAVNDTISTLNYITK